MTRKSPVWATDIAPLFAEPYWIEAARRSQIGYWWTRCMAAYLIDFTDPKSVQEWSVTIYNHLASRNMPLTIDTTQHWPAEALETFRLWVNQGYRVTVNDPYNEAPRIPAPSVSAPSLRVRKDIASMSEVEINALRTRLDDVMHICDPSPDSPWQRWAYIHTNWCLHYQEAFGFWHRAYLMYLEELIDMPIPYWDWMAADAADPTSANAGLPQAFLDETYVHPDGTERPNPLRYAAAKDGCSKLCVLDPKIPNAQCSHVNRYPVFTDPKSTVPQPRAQYFAMPQIFQQQVSDALLFDTFSTPQGVWGAQGTPWANIPTFAPPQDDALYPFREVNFDGLYEQPHDNYHAWIGYDMADNAYTAFDPIFIAYHANIDRMLEVWIRNHPGAQYTGQTQLQPFTGPLAQTVDFSTDKAWAYTSIGQMAQDSRRLGYDYGPPVSPQYKAKTGNAVACSQSKAKASTAAPEPAALAAGPWVVFDGVRCTQDSYTIDVFVQMEAPAPSDVGPHCAHYVGRFSRIGMGVEDDKGRCITTGVSRMMSARRNIADLCIDEGTPIALSSLVTRLADGHVLSRNEAAELPGFIPEFFWGDPRQPITAAAQGTGCCA